MKHLLSKIKGALLLNRGDTSIPCSRCGHPYAAHVHLRNGLDCALCVVGDCVAFKL